MLANYVSFKKVSNDYEEDFCEVYNYLTDRRCRIDLKTAAFARKLNGTRDPYKVDKRFTKEEVDDMLEILNYYDILRDKRFVSKSIFALMITVWKPKVNQTVRVVAFFLNHLLLSSWLPLLVIGMIVFEKNMYIVNDNYIFVGVYLGLLLGLALHEIGHAIATLSCGGKLFEMGVMLRIFIPGAYVLSDLNRVKSRFYRIQVHAAGVETNFSIVGISLILSVLLYRNGGIFLGAAFSNLILALINSTFVNGLDGAHIIGELLCGDMDFINKAKKIVHSKRIRSNFKRIGINGHATVAISYIMVGLQVFLPVFYIFDIIQVIRCFL